MEHAPVLAQEVIELLVTDTNGNYVDCTFGRGGHARLLLASLNTHAQLLAFDRDPLAVAAAPRLADRRMTVVHDRFSNLDVQLHARGLSAAIDGVLFDLGVSSPQLDDGNRGFSFRHDGPLDMRMDPTQGQTAADYLARVSERELTVILSDYGEERFAARIARAIVIERKKRSLRTTGQLADLVRRAVPVRRSRIDPATRTFQALRIEINDELKELEAALPQATEVLRVGGRVAVIAFHSLEDRLVKRYFRDRARQPNLAAPKLGCCAYEVLTRKPILATRAERDHNSRARSARLRVLERIQ